jgi:hypothetical protein
MQRVESEGADVTEIVTYHGHDINCWRRKNARLKVRVFAWNFNQRQIPFGAFLTRPPRFAQRRTLGNFEHLVFESETAAVAGQHRIGGFVEQRAKPPVAALGDGRLYL